MNGQDNPNEKSDQSQDPQEQRQREQQRQDQGGKKQGFDKDQIPQGGPSDNGPRTAPEGG